MSGARSWRDSRTLVRARVASRTHSARARARALALMSHSSSRADADPVLIASVMASTGDSFEASRQKLREMGMREVTHEPSDAGRALLASEAQRLEQRERGELAAAVKRDADLMFQLSIDNREAQHRQMRARRQHKFASARSS